MTASPTPPSANAPGFSAAERALLTRYVTNTEGAVFALTNLPEVIKGALFSRYSRSERGLRELLLREFIQAPESEFHAISGIGQSGEGEAEPPAGSGGEPGGSTPSGSTPSGSTPSGSTAGAHLAVQRAQAFYSRILDGYGDDSIGELGGAHLAIEQVSMIATKVLEDARIGGSPLEKSTRYVYFADKHEGDYLFLKEPALMASVHRERYQGACRLLFETYGALMAPMTAHVERAAPRPDGTSEAAWRRSVRARALDALRGLLPASALTNMGIFGNGRFFETLLLRLRLSNLAELQGLGASMGNELSKVIPSFVRRAHPEHPHFAGFRDYQHALADLERQTAQSITPGSPDTPRHAALPTRADDEQVALEHWDSEAPARVLAALAYPHSAEPWQHLLERMAALSPNEQAARLQALADLRSNRRHKPPRALELAPFTFDLLGDYGMYRDLHRHRTLTQQRQPLTTRHGYVMPEEVAAAGLEAPYRAAMESAAAAFEAIAADLPEQAQYVVPMAYRIRWQMHLNLRALIWMVELRSQPAGHPAYRRMAQQMYRAAAAAQPVFAPLFKFVDLADYPLGRIGAEQRTEEKRGGG